MLHPCQARSSTHFHTETLHTQVEARNSSELDNLRGETHAFPHILILSFQSYNKFERIVPLQPTARFPLLQLKIGAQVMHTYNQPPRLANGTLGEVVSLNGTPLDSDGAAACSPYQDGVPVVRWRPARGSPFESAVRPTHRHIAFGECEDESPDVDVHESHSLNVSRELLQSEEAHQNIFCLPIVLAFAMTIHKSIGANLDWVVLDCGTGLFGPYMLRVATTRVPSASRMKVILTHFGLNRLHLIHTHAVRYMMRRIRSSWPCTTKAHSC